MLQRLLKNLPDFLESAPRDVETERRIACAVLLLECARADFEHCDVELAQVRQELAGHFQLSEREVDQLMQISVEKAEQSSSLHEYVRTLNQDLGPADKRDIMAQLWRIAFADGRLDPHEEHLLRRLSDLLHIPHSDFIATKLHVAGGQAK